MVRSDLGGRSREFRDVVFPGGSGAGPRRRVGGKSDLVPEAPPAGSGRSLTVRRTHTGSDRGRRGSVKKVGGGVWQHTLGTWQLPGHRLANGWGTTM